MKRKLLSFLLTICLIMPCALFLTACGSNPSDEPHTCSWETDWTTNSTYHWHVCENDNCVKTKDKDAHTLINGVCSICNYVKNSSNSDSDNPSNNPSEESYTLDYKLGNDGTYYIVSGIGNFNNTELVIPETYKEKPIKEIGYAAFKNYTFIETVKFPETIINIGIESFYGCSSIKSINLPNNLVEIGNKAFYGCKKLQSLDLNNNLTSICDEAFNFCSALTELIIPSKITNIGENAFSHCYNLMTLTLYNATPFKNNLGKTYFESCYRLIEIYNLTGESLSNISAELNSYHLVEHTSLNNKSTISRNQDGYVFYYDNTEYYLINYLGSSLDICLPSSYNNKSYVLRRYALMHKELEKIEILNNINVIDVKTFMSCNNLSEIKLPNTIESISKQALYPCLSLTTIYYNGTIDDWNLINLYDDGTYLGQWTTKENISVICLDGNITVNSSN